jgi:hypothetical protein
VHVKHWKIQNKNIGLLINCMNFVDIFGEQTKNIIIIYLAYTWALTFFKLEKIKSDEYTERKTSSYTENNINQFNFFFNSTKKV